MFKTFLLYLIWIIVGVSLIVISVVLWINFNETRKVMYVAPQKIYTSGGTTTESTLRTSTISPTPTTTSNSRVIVSSSTVDISGN